MSSGHLNGPKLENYILVWINMKEPINLPNNKFGLDYFVAKLDVEKINPF